MEIVYSQHFQARLLLRGLPQGLAESIFHQAREHFYDSSTETFVAVQSWPFPESLKDMALIYRILGPDRVVFITIHPLKDGQKERRVQSGRWTPYDPESAL